MGHAVQSYFRLDRLKKIVIFNLDETSCINIFLHSFKSTLAQFIFKQIYALLMSVAKKRIASHFQRSRSVTWPMHEGRLR